MDPAARAALLSIPEEDLAVAKPDEIALYARALELEAQLLSPLDVAVTVSKAKRYAHVELLNTWLMALMQGRLYFDGPGPMPVPAESGEVDEEGRPLLVHPSRGDRPVYNLAISMPPRHGKSFLVSEHLPVWFLCNYPQYALLLASYEAKFAAEWGAKARDHIVDHPEFGIQIDGGRNAASGKWDLDGHRGYMKTAGVGGPLTGSGGQVIVIDDPIKNDEEAMSAVIRDRAENWWHTTVYTRREPWDDGTPCRVILMATRWHEDDLNGRLVPEKPKMGDRWAKINLMALFQPNDDEPIDLLGREPGEALCPARFSAGELREVRDNSEKSATWFEALYQGHPALDDGNLIKRPFNYYDLDDGVYRTTDRNGNTAYVREADCYRFGTLDVAGTDSKRADYTVLAVFDVTKETPRRAFLRALERVRVTTENHEQCVTDWYAEYGLQAIHVEDRTFGTNLIRRLTGKPGIIVSKLKADTNKIFRALPVNYEIENEMLWFPRHASWLMEFEREVTKFPNTTHDDQVDALAYGVQLYKGLPAYLTRPKDPETPMEVAIAHRKELAGKDRRKRRLIPGIGRW